MNNLPYKPSPGYKEFLEMRDLQLNELVPNYKGFWGITVERMPDLIAEGRIPISVADLMKRRLEVLTSFDNVKKNWWDCSLDTGDAIVYHPAGKIKIVLDAQHLRRLTPKSELKDGALVLPAGVYEYLVGEEFTKNEIRKYAGKKLTKREASKNPFWRSLSRDYELLKEYVDSVFRRTKEIYQYSKNMGVYFASFQDVPTMRLWSIDYLEKFGSGAVGVKDLDDCLGKSLVGVIFERTTCPTPEQVLSIVENFISERDKDSLEKEIRALYK